jgi:hypothetical protein
LITPQTLGNIAAGDLPCTLDRFIMGSPESVWSKKPKKENRNRMSIEKPDMSIEGEGD